MYNCIGSAFSTRTMFDQKCKTYRKFLNTEIEKTIIHLALGSACTTIQPNYNTFRECMQLQYLNSILIHLGSACNTMIWQSYNTSKECMKYNDLLKL